MNVPSMTAIACRMGWWPAHASNATVESASIGAEHWAPAGRCRIPAVEVSDPKDHECVRLDRIVAPIIVGPMAHEHHHHHDHSHAAHDRAFAIGAALNIGFVIAEVVFGMMANSVALLADAAHNLGDVLGLLLGWGAAWLTRLPPTRRRTYGWGRSSILAALLNATILLISVGAIGVEAVQRLLSPAPVMEGTVILVAIAGIVVNGATALLFLRDRGHDINLRAQFLHMAADAAVSGAVVLAGLLIMLTGWLWLDPLASLGIAVVIVV